MFHCASDLRQHSTVPRATERGLGAALPLDKLAAASKAPIDLGNTWERFFGRRNSWRHRKSSRRFRLIFRAAGALGLGLALTVPGFGQMPAEEHKSHHPSGQNIPGQTRPGASQPVSPGTGAGSGDGMGDMMREMRAPPPKELYPSLMELPSSLPSEKRDELKQRARDRMTAGRKLLSDGIEALSRSAADDDVPGIEQATARLRQGLAQFESGLAVHQALVGGKPPRSIALEWFRREMRMETPGLAEAPRGVFGLSWFHYVTIFILLTFATTMVWMWIRRMNRAEALAANLTSAKQAVPATPIRQETEAPGGTETLAAEQQTPGGATASTAYKVVAPAALPAGRWSGQLRVAQIFQETVEVRTFRLMHPAGGDLPFVFQPGQFLTVSVTIEGRELRRSYSISSSPCCRGWCEITVKHAPHGSVSGFLHEQIKANDLIGASGPYGKFSFRGTESPSIVLIAGGVGITPLMSALRYLTDQSWSGGIFLIYACATLKDIIFREELEYLVRRHPNLHVSFVLSDETSADWIGPRGYITKELLLQTVPDLGSRRVHLCGPLPMMQAVTRILGEIGVPSDQVKTETFLGPEPTPPPHTGGPVSAPPAPGLAVPVCSFVRSGKTAPLPADKTVLEASEDVGVNIEYSCRQGYCGVCKTKLLSGQVAMAVEDGLSLEDKAAQLILACQAKAATDIAVEA